MLRLAQAGQMRVDDGGVGAFMAEVDLDLAEVLALFEQMRGVTVPQRMHVRGLFDAAARTSAISWGQTRWRVFSQKSLKAQMTWVLVWRATCLCALRWMQYWRNSSAEISSGDLP